MSPDNRTDPLPTPEQALSLFLRKYRLLDHLNTNSLFWAGVSGGADSICLLYALAGVPEIFERLTVLYFNHRTDPSRNIREESFVREIAQKVGARFLSGAPPIGFSDFSEEMLRAQRYRFFEEHLRQVPGSVLFLGHHLTDQAETIFMNLFRNRGLRGLFGMEEFREQRYARPFLSLPSLLLRQTLEERRISYLEDPSNRDLRYLRNRVRHELSPLIKAIFPPAGIESLPRLGELFSKEVRPMLPEIHTLAEEERYGEVILSLSLYRFLSPVRQSCLIESLLARQSRWGLSLPPPGNILRSLDRTPPYCGPMGGGWTLSVVSGKIRLVHQGSHPGPDPEYSPFLSLRALDTIGNMRQNVILPRGGMLVLSRTRTDPDSSDWEKGIKVSRQCFLSQELTTGLTIGYPFQGAKLDPAFGGDPSVNLSRKLKHSRLTRENRNRLPVLYRNGGALWIPGVVPLPRPCFSNEPWGLTLTYLPWKES